MKRIILFCVWVAFFVFPGNWGAKAEAQSSALRALILQLHAADMRVREQAYLTFSSSATLQNLDFLHQLLQEHPESRVRWRVARVIGRLGAKMSIPVLAATLREDESLYVRRNAAWALADINDRSAFDALKQAMMDDDDPSVRKRAATALSSLGGADADRLIERALQEEGDGAVRITLEWLLKRRKHAGTERLKVKRGEIVEGSYKGSQYLLYVPKTLWPWKRMDVLISVHGTDGVPEPYMKMCLEDAEKYDMVVIAPRFDYPNFPNYDRLNLELGAMRSDLWLLGVIADVAKKVRVHKERFRIFGHSKGGQFVQRFVRAHPERIVKAVAAASGYYLGSSSKDVFPEGLSPNPFMPDRPSVDFGKFVLTPMLVVIGTDDLARRLEAADRFMEEVRAYAKQHKLPCNISFSTVPDGQHSGTENYPSASQFLFEKGER